MQRHFVPENTMDTRKETAVLLVGTAREFGISQRSIQSTYGGFWITQELADVLYDESEQDEPEVSGNPEPEPVTKKKTSGNRAAKNQPTEE